MCGTVGQTQDQHSFLVDFSRTVHLVLFGKFIAGQIKNFAGKCLGGTVCVTFDLKSSIRALSKLDTSKRIAISDTRGTLVRASRQTD